MTGSSSENKRHMFSKKYKNHPRLSFPFNTASKDIFFALHQKTLHNGRT